MITAKERFYYTWRQRADGKWDCNKWDQLGDESQPEATYIVDPFFGGWRGSCSCEAWTTCKHIKQLQAVLHTGPKDEGVPAPESLPFMKWDAKNGWQEANI